MLILCVQMHWKMCMIYVSVCDDTLHSCPILEIVALPVCSPSMAFSLKNRKILSSSGLSLSGIRCIPRNLGSGINNASELQFPQDWKKKLSCLKSSFWEVQTHRNDCTLHWIPFSCSKMSRDLSIASYRGSLLPSRDRSLLQKRNVTRPPPTWAAHA